MKDAHVRNAWIDVADHELLLVHTLLCRPSNTRSWTLWGMEQLSSYVNTYDVTRCLFSSVVVTAHL